MSDAEVALSDDWTGTGFVPRTLRTGAVVGAVIVLTLASYGQTWAIGPFLTGLALSAVLLQTWDMFIRRLTSPGALQKVKVEGKRKRLPIIGFSLIKYILVGLLLYVAVRIWHGDSYRAMAFLGGCILLHLIIGLRAIGRALQDRGA